MKKLQHKLEYALVIALSAVMRLLPLRLVLWKGRFIGLLFYYFIPIRKSVTIQNIAETFPDKSPKQVRLIARNTYIQFGINITEYMRQTKVTAKELAERFTFVNEHLFQQAYDKGNGAILLSGHFGNWELMGGAIRSLGFPIVAIAKEQSNSLIDKVIANNRIAVRVETLQLGMALRGVLKSLRENKFVAILGDQDAHDEGVFVDFLGRPSSTAPGPAIFSLKTGAPIIFGNCVREPKGKYTVYLEEVKTDDLEGVTEENIQILTQRHAKVFEKSIRKWPDHWFWMHKRWKTQPKDKQQNKQ
jgi:Kdo2-lipid IVA lauroyltransferase/acyltransferase